MSVTPAAARHSRDRHCRIGSPSAPALADVSLGARPLQSAHIAPGRFTAAAGFHWGLRAGELCYAISLGRPLMAARSHRHYRNHSRRVLVPGRRGASSAEEDHRQDARQRLLGPPDLHKLQAGAESAALARCAIRPARGDERAARQLLCNRCPANSIWRRLFAISKRHPIDVARD